MSLLGAFIAPPKMAKYNHHVHRAPSISETHPFTPFRRKAARILLGRRRWSSILSQSGSSFTAKLSGRVNPKGAVADCERYRQH
jgi:hypothetical protein